MKTNLAAKRVLCFGDSNTWGYIPGTDHERLHPGARWTGVLQLKLGESYDILEEGLCSRTIATEDPRIGKEGRNGLAYIKPCLETHVPDYLVVMLGTNDCKFDYGKSPEMIGKDMRRFIEVASGFPAFQQRRQCLLLLSPPIINDKTEYCMAGGKYKEAGEKSEALGGIYVSLAEEFGCTFQNIGAL